jgi:two-component system sensor histidine kinase KdpD
MVPVDGRLASAGLIRETARMAAAQGAVWLAVYLDASQRTLYTRQELSRLGANLCLAEELGADLVCFQPAERPPGRELLALAKAHRVTDLVLDSAGRSRWLGQPKGAHPEPLNPRDLGLVIQMVNPLPEHSDPRLKAWPESMDWGHLGLALFIVLLATGVGFVVYHYLGVADVIMLYMLCITVAATQFGRWTTFIASVAAILTLDFCFIEPRYTFVVTDFQHIGTFGLMFGVGWVILGLAERIRSQTTLAQERERHSRALFRLGQVLAEGGSPEAIQHRVEEYLRRELEVPLAVLLCTPKGDLADGNGPDAPFTQPDLALARQALKLGAPVGQGTETSPQSRWFMLPLAGLERTVGVLAVQPRPEAVSLPPDRMSLLVPLASQVSLALERASLAEERTQARIRAEHAQLRATLLSSLSHDLKTPLGSITGAITTLLDPGPNTAPGDQKVLLNAIHHESRRLLRMVNNLLDITKLESGQVQVKKDWVAVEEIVEAAISHMEEQMGSRPLSVDLPEQWVHVDPVLLDQALVNLLDNALKFSPPGSAIRIHGAVQDGAFRLQVEDEGPGIPPGEEELIFEKLYRGTGGALAPGAGLGLAICRAIAEAHGGTVTAGNQPGGGARLTISLPLENGDPGAVLSQLNPDLASDLKGAAHES